MRSAVRLWADATTFESVSRRADLIKKKQEAIETFFAFIDKNPGEVDDLDVARWVDQLRQQKLKPATLFARISLSVVLLLLGDA